MTLRALAACALLVTTAVHAEEYLDVVSSYHHDLPIYGRQSVDFVETFNAISPDVQFRRHDPGKLVPASQALDAVSSGHVDAAFSLAGYWWDRLPTAMLFSSFPFEFDPNLRLAWMIKGNGLALYQEMYDRAGYDVVVLPCGSNPGEISGWFREEIRTVEDLAGLRMRVYGMGGQVLEKLGVQTVNVLADELSFAIKTGDLDGAEFGAIAADVFLGLHENAGYVYFPPWNQPSGTTELLVNRAVWHALTEAQRQAMRTACIANITFSIADAEIENARAFNEVKANSGVAFRSWPPEVMAAIRVAWDELVAENLARDPFFRKTWADIENFRSEGEGWRGVSTVQQ